MLIVIGTVGLTDISGWVVGAFDLVNCSWSVFNNYY